MVPRQEEVGALFDHRFFWMTASYLADLQQTFDTGSCGKKMMQEKMRVNKRRLGRVCIRSDQEVSVRVVLKGVGGRLVMDY